MMLNLHHFRALCSSRAQSNGLIYLVYLGGRQSPLSLPSISTFTTICLPPLGPLPTSGRVPTPVSRNFRTEKRDRVWLGPFVKFLVLSLLISLLFTCYYVVFFVFVYLFICFYACLFFALFISELFAYLCFHVFIRLFAYLFLFYGFIYLFVYSFNIFLFICLLFTYSFYVIRVLSLWQDLAYLFVSVYFCRHV